MTRIAERDLPRGTALVTMALAACAGAVDLLAFAGLGGVFAGVVTGNLVVAGAGIGTGGFGKIGSAVLATAGFTAGLVAWSRLWRRRPRAILGQLAAEFAVLAVVAGGWLAARGRPGPVAAQLLLVLLATAMGGQSITALRLHSVTTYMTGMITGALHDLVTGRSADPLAALRQIAALVAGAMLASAVFVVARGAVALLPAGLVAAAIVVRLLGERAAARRRRTVR
ncbi:hypothetical protein Arub01_53820 [Actinomadura rubrobrunea]|uniref:DUF1275 domain-containing protein n=1 Tax=Actinomadura rubrobrunea TaxID=115335 RepID=A0A9W6PZB4_9ACTN|nr:YoaK family protein [Actinomadura rubrobrunea]GLW67139.1 hypothetical protein Arub01_53820 [Actinomadura rubrobrunea]